ncbi:hypothetical protein B0T22DRAFT_438503 [Podospora appendiculata]|uniref:Pre-mRNA-splicing factor 38B n=1 Tax=Podospora appendiculata TaxID=314037 RepID=A0AAE1CI88_9PEZI|nr:hypothetical protein B0T22DRAFT_438503 [Podospora appendiculata]
MASDTILTDDYVAGVLAKEASDASIKYSSVGLEAFRSAKPANKAKPNTRFLGRIIKETTNHNAALLAREAAEAQARLDHLTETEEKKRRKLNPSAVDMRRRQLGDISSILLGGKRKRAIEGDGKTPSRASGSAAVKSKDERSPKKDSHGKRKEARRAEDDEAGDGARERRSARHHREDDNRRHRERSRSPGSRQHKYRHRSPLAPGADDDNDGDQQPPRPSRSHHSGSKSGKDGNNRSASDLIGSELSKRIRHGRLAQNDERRASSTRQRAPDNKSDHGEDEDDSDPLEDFIGPALPSSSSTSAVRPRGRGAVRGTAAMDSRFSHGYDPSSDMQLDHQPEDTGAAGEDWDEAVEVYRDRQKWKQQGADRLRAAGFTDDQVRKWEKQGPSGEKDLDDVQWSKAGEKREWDRGKDKEL